MANVFEHFLEFPADVRRVVINEMEPDDRCRFTRCSSICQKEAQKCTNYIYGMKLYVYYQNSIKFSVIYHEKHKNYKHGDYNMHLLQFYDGNKYIIYTNRYGKELWITQLNNSINIGEYACEHVKSMLNIYQRTIKKLDLHKTANYDFEIRSLSNLESLTIGDNTDIQQIISKIRKPLKKFVCSPSISEIFTREFQQIFEVQNWLNASRIHLDYAQFLQLSASNIRINIGILTEENISDFIKSWRNGKLRKNFRYCEWCIRDWNFDIQKLFRLLSIHQNVEERQRWKKVDIRHNTFAGKKAELGFNQNAVEFRVINK